MIGDKKEKTFVVMVNGILTTVPESKLTMEQQGEIFGKLVAAMNASSTIARGWLAQAIFKQNGVDVYPPGVPLPKFTKKEKKGMKTVVIKDHSIENKKTSPSKGHVL